MTLLRNHSGLSPLGFACNSPVFCYRHPEHLQKGYFTYKTGQKQVVTPPEVCRTLQKLLSTYGCRISELLCLTVGDIIRDDLVLVKAAKNSIPYVISLPELSLQLEGFGPNDKKTKIFPVTYNFVYRWCVRCGYSRKFEGRRNQSVTHLGRHCFAADVGAIANKSTVGNTLHHRSSRSVEYYLHSKGASHG
jgi:integrase